MPCFHPLTAYLSAYQTNNATGKQFRRISFKETDDCDRQISLNCGQCVGCRLERSRQWATRCLHEAQLHEKNCFLTLTYDNEHLPENNSLNHRDFQLFFKRFRKANPHIRIRYYMAGEYGSTFGRPHFHACIFGYDFHDKELFKRTASGSVLYRSKELEKLWPHGYSTIGDVTFESAAYVARYIMQKQTGKTDPEHYSYCDLETGELIKLKPEYNKMSLKPGIGAEWYKKYKDEVYPNDNVVIRGHLCKPPRYYDKLYSRDNPYEYDELLFKREKQGKLKPEEKTPERLQVKEKVLKARINLNKRTNLENNE